MRFDHLFIAASDVDETADFLTRILGFEEGYRPPFSFPGKWIYSEGQAIFHLVQSTGAPTVGTVRHIAFRGADYQTLVSRLRENGLEYGTSTVPSTNDFQVFVEGPDGLKFEFLFDSKLIQTENVSLG